MTNTTNQHAGIILAAGLSSRAGEFKPLMQFNGEFAIHHIIRKLGSVCDRIIVVTGHRASEVDAAVSVLHDFSVTCVVNKDWERGMFTSMQTGVAALPNRYDFFLHMVDQPHVPVDVYTALLESVDDIHYVFIPTFEDRRGHPLMCRAVMKERIIAAESNATLREVLHSIPDRIMLVSVRTDAILHTANTPEDAQFIRKHYSL